ncbi:MAG TPA: hypothetical protein VKK79_19455 [Candidatus Lokiarchaeia archaeon]|nr:hypothetical protein [Candidatus Lokiarchaeia archaeon]
MEVSSVWKHMIIGDPRNFWKSRLVLCIIELTLFLIVPLVVGWSVSDVVVIGTFYSYESNPSSSGGVAAGGLLPNLFASFANYAPLMVWLLVTAFMWWMATALFLPLLLGIVSCIETRKAVNDGSLISIQTKLKAKVAAILPFANTIAIMAFWIVALFSPAQMGEAAFYFGMKEFFIAPLVAVFFTIYHVWITFEGNHFRALDFRESGTKAAAPGPDEPPEPKPEQGRIAKMRMSGKLF